MGDSYKYQNKEVIVSGKDTTTNSYSTNTSNLRTISFPFSGGTMRTFSMPYQYNTNTTHELNFISPFNVSSSSIDYGHRVKDGRSGERGATSYTRNFFYLASNQSSLTNYKVNGKPYIQFLTVSLNGTTNVSWPSAFNDNNISVITRSAHGWTESVDVRDITSTGATVRGYGIDSRNGENGMGELTGNKTAYIMAIQTGVMPFYKNGYPMIIAGTGTTDTDGTYTVSWTTAFEDAAKMSIFISSRGNRSNTVEAYSIRNVTTTSFTFNSMGRGTYQDYRAIPFSYVVIAHDDSSF
jgi:hypothetical protein